MAGRTPTEIDTTLSDRAILVHLLEHVEAMWDLLEEFRPLLDMLRARNGGGQLDMIGVLQLRREARKAARRGDQP